jgi:hypothetical protein
MYHTSGNIPKHQYVYVDKSFISDDTGFIPAVWFGVSSIPGRMWGLHVMLECGAVYRALPPHAITFNPSINCPWNEKNAQLWDCYSNAFSVVEYNYLNDMNCTIFPSNEKGRYLFTVIPFGEGFSNYPEQAKEFFFIKLNNGRLSVQPTNKIQFFDPSFTEGNIPPLKVSQKIYRCENIPPEI